MSAEETYYKELIKGKMKTWLLLGLVCSLFLYPLARAFVSEHSIEFSGRAILGLLIAYELIRNKNRPHIVTKETYAFLSKLTAVEFFFIGSYFVIGAVHIYYIWT